MTCHLWNRHNNIIIIIDLFTKKNIIKIIILLFLVKNMFKYDIISSWDFLLSKKIIDNIFFFIYKNVNKKQNWIINLIFLDDKNIKDLNNNYRKINKTTDVLSFHYFNDFSKINDNDIAWEIIFSKKKIIYQWKKYWLWEEKEFYKLLIHSLLHILWYDHEIEKDYIIMKQMENKIWKEVFEK